MHAGDSEAACDARHFATRSPPGETAPHNERTSPPHADLSTKISSRGRSGRNTRTGAAAGAAAGAVVVVAAAAGALPLTALTAC
ncbi:MAG: hypothetical protein BGP05_02185 [Rhizobiales bacterium 62-47]|nr:MAG: hypothetical protein BGP05_02185 [Rhizobiales bacterium 62-47]